MQCDHVKNRRSMFVFTSRYSIRMPGREGIMTMSSTLRKKNLDKYRNLLEGNAECVLAKRCRICGKSGNIILFKDYGLFAHASCVTSRECLIYKYNKVNEKVRIRITGRGACAIRSEIPGVFPLEYTTDGYISNSRGDKTKIRILKERYNNRTLLYKKNLF